MAEVHQQTLCLRSFPGQRAGWILADFNWLIGSHTGWRRPHCYEVKRGQWHVSVKLLNNPLLFLLETCDSCYLQNPHVINLWTPETIKRKQGQPVFIHKPGASPSLCFLTTLMTCFAICREKREHVQSNQPQLYIPKRAVRFSQNSSSPLYFIFFEFELLYFKYGGV